VTYSHAANLAGVESSPSGVDSERNIALFKSWP